MWLDLSRFLSLTAPAAWMRRGSLGCAVVTVASTGDKIGKFDTVVARSIAVVDDSGAIVITLAPGDEEMNEDKNSGHIKTYDASSDTAKMLVSLGQYGYSGLVEVYHSNYYSGYDTQTAVSLGSDGLLGGEVMTWHINGERAVRLGSEDDADQPNGFVETYNSSGKKLVEVTSFAEYGTVTTLSAQRQRVGEAVYEMGTQRQQRRSQQQDKRNHRSDVCRRIRQRRGMGWQPKRDGANAETWAMMLPRHRQRNRKDSAE